MEIMLRINFMQQWVMLSDPAIEEALRGMPLFCEFASVDWDTRLLDESTVLCFRHLLRRNSLAEEGRGVVKDLLRDKRRLLKTGTGVDATLIAAPNSTENASGERDLDMHQTMERHRW
jgi:IS5 family transposase